MKIGDKVRVTKCDVCPKVVGKTATVTKLNSSEDGVPTSVGVTFGRGRPQKSRPVAFLIDEISLIDIDVQV
ncbi:hypothetical protein LCGC14_0219900 [marine sediment metagenome]|uniref:KOW domain-containing protein n=1 Tax=marine sediment metagenome TaxID=412755 RepID=A0A0F9UD60_9ZZZZ